MLPRNDATEKIGFALVRIIVPLWILMGVAMKLYAGTAANLPSTIVELSKQWQLNLDAVLYTLIGLEIFAILVMVFIARLARPMAIFMLLSFISILIGEIVKNAESCGCFGGTIKIEPWQMLVADSLLLLGVLLFRPPFQYGRTRPGRTLLFAAGALAVGMAVSFGVGHRLHGIGAAPGDHPQDASGDPAVNPSPRPVGTNWYPRDVPSWVGTPWRESEMFQVMHRWPEGLDEGRHYIVFYSRTCSHCETMFEDDLTRALGAPVIAIEIPAGRNQLTSADAWEMPEVHPSVTFTNLQLGPDWSLLTPPLAMRIEDGIVTCAREGDHKECFEIE